MKLFRHKCSKPGHTGLGAWYYLYCAVDKYGQTIDFLLSAHRDEPAATRFLMKAIRRNGVPETITIDGSEANAAAIRSYTRSMEPGSPFSK